MATAQCSYGPSLIFTQSEATAAQRTWAFHLVKSADSTDATGLVPVMTISKAGAAFAAVDAGTVITELTNGWYKVVHAAADLDTLGCLAVRVAVATADTLNVAHQVTALDLNVATVNPATGGIDAGSFTSAALAAISTPLVPSLKTFTVGTPDADYPISMLGAIDTTVEVTGTFGGATVQVQTTEDPTAAVPVWTNRGAAIVASNAATPLVVTGPHNAIRAHVTGSSGTTEIALKYTIRKPAVVGG